MRRRYYSPWVIGTGAILLVVSMFTSGVRAVTAATPGEQGTDTALPATPSALTVNGRDAYASLAITVNQTASLTNQAVSITWTGGQPTISGPGRFGAQYLQVMQCWGDDDGTVPDNPGPPPEQCVSGAVAGVYGGIPGGLYPSGFALSRVISRSDWVNFDPNVGVLETATTNVWMPFRAVTGEKVDIQTDPNFNPSVVGGNFWLNPFFNIITTNEIAAAATGADGTGAELFEVQTGEESSGLGCGQSVQPVQGGGTKVPKCWIVVVPRGTAAEENVGTPFADGADQFGVATSPLSPSAWQHRIAIPIDFTPVDSPCSLADDSRRMSGGEIALPAIASWQPALCTTPGLPPYSYAPVADAAARQQLTSNAPGAPGLVVVSRPIDPATLNPDNPVVYSPVSVSGLTIGFNIERNPRIDAPPEEQAIAGVRVADLNLTPRLIAKLLTQSYQGQINIQVPPGYPWAAANPAHLGLDPDFLRFNPEFTMLQIADTRTFSGLQLPAGNSDAAEQLWEYVLADPEARAWLGGKADEWGMKVNPYYSTKAASNPAKIAFGTPLPTSYPKSDPYCFQADPVGAGNSVKPPVLCGTDWMPYTRGFADSARIARIAADGAKIVENTFAQATSDVWTRELPQFLGRRSILALTDTPSAEQYGLQMARLSRAGDNGATRAFIRPDTAGLTAGVASMRSKKVKGFLEPAPTVKAPKAYPLTTMTYAAIAPLALDRTARAEYAAFLAYAATDGQVPGLALGQLPRGFAPLSRTLQQQGVAAAVVVLALKAPPTTTTTTTEPTTTEPTVPTTFPSGGGGDCCSSGGGGGGFGDGSGDGSGGIPTDTTPVVESSTSTSVAATSTSVDAAPAPTTTVVGAITPSTDVSGSRLAIPGIGLMALGSALGALEITKRPRRVLSPEHGPDTLPSETD